MPTTIITLGRFLQYQGAFCRANEGSPVNAKVIVTRANDLNPLSTFVGTSPREVDQEHSLPILYSRDISPVVREKFGLEQDRNSSIYISPLVLSGKFSYWKFQEHLTRIDFFDGERYIVEKIFNHGYIPSYGSCIAVEFVIKKDIKGA